MLAFRVLTSLVLTMGLWLNSLALGPDNRWREWNKDLLLHAKKENKFVILDLEAVWCHWCHVMDKVTYHNPKVGRLLDKYFIAVRVDQDSRPDLANKYKDYGWPATIIFSPEGKEIAKRRGYINPEKMIALLQAVVAKKLKFNSPVAQNIVYNKSGELSTTLSAKLISRHHSSFDPKRGSLRLFQKFMDPDSVEYAMLLASNGNKKQARRVKKTLYASIALIDPVWGGVYQYSTHSDWKHPHFEKIMSIQAGHLRIYSQAYSQFKDGRYLAAALKIYQFLDTLLKSKEGVFYTSQDADLKQGEHSGAYFKLSNAERRKQGIPQIDKNIYARENGWVAEALIVLYQATGNKKYLRRAKHVIKWVIKNRYLKTGGFHHGAKDSAGPYLGDSLAMAKALLSLYEVTDNKKWLSLAIASADFIGKNFRDIEAGYDSALVTDQMVEPEQFIDENISVVRLMAQLYFVTGQKKYKSYARYGMRYLATPAIATRRITEAGILLAKSELRKAESKHTRINHQSKLDIMITSHRLMSGMVFSFGLKPAHCK